MPAKKLINLSINISTNIKDEGESKMKKINIYTDGACKNNPGPGGYGIILEYNDIKKEISGGSRDTTNNIMELTAVIEALKALNQPCEVNLYSDSQYVCNAINKNWLNNWEKSNWKKADKKPVANRELWQQLSALLEMHKVNFIWVKGHAGHPENERCDKLATAEAAKFQKN